MSRDVCKLPSCDRTTGQQKDRQYRKGSFCCMKHEVKFEHLKADARDAKQAEQERLEEHEP